MSDVVRGRLYEMIERSNVSEREVWSPFAAEIRWGNVRTTRKIGENPESRITIYTVELMSDLKLIWNRLAPASFESVSINFLVLISLPRIVVRFFSFPPFWPVQLFVTDTLRPTTRNPTLLALAVPIRSPTFESSLILTCNPSAMCPEPSSRLWKIYVGAETVEKLNACRYETKQRRKSGNCRAP